MVAENCCIFNKVLPEQESGGLIRGKEVVNSLLPYVPLNLERKVPSRTGSEGALALPDKRKRMRRKKERQRRGVDMSYSQGRNRRTARRQRREGGKLSWARQRVTIFVVLPAGNRRGERGGRMPSVTVGYG